MSPRTYSSRFIKTATCASVILLVMFMTLSCGQKGPLRIPENEKQAAEQASK